MSADSKPADLNEPGLRRNPGEPDARQAATGTYNKPRLQWQGLTIAIENPAGSVRRGRNRHGVSWEVRMRYEYGEILGTMGVDGDPVDVIIGPNLDATMVYVVHQRRVNDWGNFDEDKCCVGFDSQSDAAQAFLSNYNDPRFLGPITAMPVNEFVAKVRATKQKPAMIKALFLKTHVNTYVRKDGTVVAAHEDKRAAAKKRFDDYSREKFEKYGPGWHPKATEEEKAEYERLRVDLNNAISDPAPALKKYKKGTESKVRLFHGSHEKNISEIKDNPVGGGKFPGLFAVREGAERAKAAKLGGGAFAHYMDVPESKIATHEIMRNLSGRKLNLARKTIREHLSGKPSKDELDALEKVILDDDALPTKDQELSKRLVDLLDRDVDYNNEGGASWAAQAIRGKVANALGFQAVAMHDEMGTSYLVLPGVKVNPHSGSDIAKSHAPAILFFKAHVGPYLRGGKMVNLNGYHTKRIKRVEASAGQSALFPELAMPEKKADPKVARALTTWMARHGGPAGMARLLADMSSEHQRKLIDAMATIGKTDAETVRKMLQAEPAPASPLDQDLFGEPQHTEPTRDLIDEHERLVDVLNSPGHADDKVEAKKQAAELAEMKQESGQYDGLLADIPGAKWRRGKGLIAGQYGVEVEGEVMGGYHAKPEDAVIEARKLLSNRAQWAEDKAAHDAAVSATRERLLAGGEATDADLKLLGLRAGSSGLEWFIPAAAKVFGISSRAVRPHIADLIRIGHTDMGAKKEFVNPAKALQAIAAGVQTPPAADRKVLFIKPPASAESKPPVPNLINNPPVETKQESKMKPLTGEQRTKIARGNAAWEAYKAGQPDGATRAAFKEAARSGQLDHLYDVQMAADAQAEAESKAAKRAKSDAWRARNVPKLAAAKTAREEAWRKEQQAAWSDPNGPRTYLDVPFGLKDEAKAAGARWDADQKRWYHTFAETPMRLQSFVARAEPAPAPAPAAKPAAAPSSMVSTLPTSGRVSEDDPSVWGSWLLGHEGEPWSSVRNKAPAHLR